MSVQDNVKTILLELQRNADRLEDADFEALIRDILNAGHIFTSAAGRSKTAVTAFTNRLMHLGRDVSLLGEITCPHTRPGDLLILVSGSGETESLVSAAQKAKKNGVRIALLTMDRKSSIGRIADTVVVLPGVSPKLKNGCSEITSVQPMGSAFEQMAFLALDAVIMELMPLLSETSESMFARHTDLE